MFSSATRHTACHSSASGRTTKETPAAVCSSPQERASSTPLASRRKPLEQHEDEAVTASGGSGRCDTRGAFVPFVHKGPRGKVGQQHPTALDGVIGWPRCRRRFALVAAYQARARPSLLVCMLDGNVHPFKQPSVLATISPSRSCPDAQTVCGSADNRSQGSSHVTHLLLTAECQCR